MRQRFSWISLTFLMYLFLTGNLAGVDNKFQSYIARSYPGFKILSSNEFERSISTETPTPGLVIGQFNHDSLQDFACLIRAENTKWDPGGYNYYDGKLVVCHGLENGKYQCLELSSMPILFHTPLPKMCRFRLERTSSNLMNAAAKGCNG